MIKITDSNIFITRGDTASINVIITDEKGNIYNLQDGDILYFNIKNTFDNNETLLTLTSNSGIFNITKEMTINFNFGSYDYDIRLEGSGIVATVISGIITIGGGTNE